MRKKPVNSILAYLVHSTDDLSSAQLRKAELVFSRNSESNIEILKSRYTREGSFQHLYSPLSIEALGPIPMIMHCPECGARHVDEGEFASRAHRTHSCQSCGFVWRPALVPTVGVRFLPGYENERCGKLGRAPYAREITPCVLPRDHARECVPEICSGRASYNP